MNDLTREIKKVIADLPEDERGKVDTAYQELVGVMMQYGNAGVLALVLLGSEMQGDD